MVQVASLFNQLLKHFPRTEFAKLVAKHKLVHLGINRAPLRSTLSYANKHRPAALFEDVFWVTLNQFRQQQLLGTRPTRFRFKNKLLSLDSTTISRNSPTWATLTCAASPTMGGGRNRLT